MTVTRRDILTSATAIGLAAPFLRLAAVRAENSINDACVASSEDCDSAPADALVEFISVQAQVDREHPVWNRPEWRPLLGGLGVRYLRSNLAGPRARDHLRVLNSEYGMRACALVMAIRDDGSFDFARAEWIIDFMRDEIGPDAIRAFEGPNEYTKNHKTGDWVGRLRDFQEFLFRRIRDEPRLKAMPVLAPTIWRRQVEDYRAIASLGSFCDHGNLHLYSGGRRPSLFGSGWNEQPIERAIDDAQLVAPGKPLCITETGFRTAALQSTSSGLPPAVAAKYTLRNITEMFLRRRDVAWMNIFALMDYSPGRDYGLIDLDLTPRPAYFALRNLIRIVADPGEAVTADQKLPFRLHADAAAHLRVVVLHKRDGRLLLLLWRDEDSYDRSTHEIARISSQPATLDFGDRRIGALRLYMPSLSDLPQEERPAITSASLQVSDDLLIAEVIL